MPSRAAGARPSLHRRPPRLPAPPAPVPPRRAAAPSPQFLATRPPAVDSLVRRCSSFLLRRAPAPSTLWSTRRFFVLCCSGELQRRVPLPSTVVPCLRCAASSTHPPSATLSPLRCCISVDFDWFPALLAINYCNLVVAYGISSNLLTHMGFMLSLQDDGNIQQLTPIPNQQVAGDEQVPEDVPWSPDLSSSHGNAACRAPPSRFWPQDIFLLTSRRWGRFLSGFPLLWDCTLAHVHLFRLLHETIQQTVVFLVFFLFITNYSLE